MTSKRSAGLAAATCVAVVLSTLALSGCGDSGNTEIQEEKPVTEALKGSMDYMQQKYASKKK